MAPLRHHIASTLVVTALLTLCAMTLPVYAQNTDIRTFQGIRFEHALTPKTYITFAEPTTAITPYTLILPPGLPTVGYILSVTGTNPFQLGWIADPISYTSLEILGTGGVRRPANGTKHGTPGLTGAYANTLQGDSHDGDGAAGDKSVTLGGKENGALAYQSSVGGGYQNGVSDTLGAVIGGSDDSVTADAGGVLSGLSNWVSGKYAVILGGEANKQSGILGFIGAGKDNIGSGSMSTIFGGSSGSNSSSSVGVLFGGSNNVVSGNRAIVLGGTSNTAATTLGAIAGGLSNAVGSNSGFLGGGASNVSTTATTPALLGGFSHVMAGSYSSIGGGQDNTAMTNYATVGGGRSNTSTSGTHTLCFTGQSNSVTANGASVLGGFTNVLSGAYAVALGGRNMTISGQNTIGMNGGSVAMSISAQNVSVVANMDVWLADNDNTPSSLRLFEQYNSSGSIDGATINYVAFQAPTSTNNNLSNLYTLPDRVGTGLYFISVATSPVPTTTTGTLEWIAIPAYDVVAYNAVGAGAFPAATDDADIIRVTSTGGAPGRITTFRNGVTNGLVVTVRFDGNQAIRVRDADANLDLQGAVDFDMDANDTLTLVWDAASTKWIELGRTVQN